MRSVILLLLLLFSFIGCKKNETGEPSHSVTLKVNVAHHAVTVSSATVYLKRDALGWPGTNPASYDLSAQVDQNGSVAFKTLLPGDFYLYGRGHDGVDSVIGYRPVKLTDDMLDRTYEVILAVSED